MKNVNKKAATTTNSISNNIPALRKLLKRKDGVSVSEAVDTIGICKRSVRKLFAELNAKQSDYVGFYKV